MKKVSLLLASLLLVTSVGTLAIKADASTKTYDITSDIYENHYQINLSDLQLSVKNDDIVIELKDIFTSSGEINKNNLSNERIMNMTKLENVLEDEEFKEELIRLVENDLTPIAIGIAEAEFEVTTNSEGEVVNVRPITEFEVNNPELKSITSRATGQTQTREKLSLYTSVSGTAPNYTASVIATWSGGNMQRGWDAAGLTWPSKFNIGNTSSATASYGWSGNVKGSPEAVDATAGICWSFPPGVDKGTIKDPLYKFSGSTSLKRTGVSSYCTIRGEYIHTYSTFDWSGQIEYSSASDTKYIISISPSKDSWSLVSWVSTTL